MERETKLPMPKVEMFWYDEESRVWKPYAIDSEGRLNIATIKSNYMPDFGISLPVTLTAGSTITTKTFETAGYDRVFFRLQGNATTWRIAQRMAFSADESPAFSNTQSTMLSPTNFNGNSNGLAGYLSVNSPYMKVEISNNGSVDAGISKLDIWVQ